MARLLVPTIEERALGTPAAPSVRPQATGFAESENLQNNINSAIGDVGQITRKMQAEEDGAAINSAVSELRETTMESQRNARELEGENARGSAARAGAEWKNKNAEIAGRLTPRQRAVYEQHAAGIGLQHTDALAIHEQGQRKIAAEGAANANVNSAISLAAQNAADPRTRMGASAQAYVVIRDQIDAMAAMGGWSKARKDAVLEERLTNLHVGILKNIYDSDPEGAKVYYAAHKRSIAGTQYDEIEKALELGGARQEAQKVGDHFQAAIVAATPSELPDAEATALAAVRAKYKGKVQDEAVAEIKRRVAERRGQVTEVKNAAGDVAWKISEQAGKYSAIPAGVISSMDGKEALALKDYWDKKVEGKAIKTDWDVYYNLLSFAQGKDTKEAFARMRLNPYFNQLSDTEKRHLTELQGKALNDPSRFHSDISLSQRLAAVAAQRGITDKEKRGSFDVFVYDRLEQAERVKGQKLDTAERDKIIDAAILEGAPRFFGFFKGKMAFETAEAERKATPAGAPAARATAADLNKIPAATQQARRQLQDIPAQDLDAIQRVLTSKGKSVTAEAILEAYAKKTRGQ